jgi:hypothetical protein
LLSSPPVPPLLLFPARVPELGRHGRRTLPPLRASPCFPDQPGSSASPSSCPQPTESSCVASTRRRPSPIPCRSGAPPPPIAWPAGALRPSRLPRRVSGEHLVQKDPFPSPIPRRRAAPLWSPAVPAVAVAVLATAPGWTAVWASGPIGQGLWVKKTLVQKVPAP